jgi:probable HAF family extracellular repeat protein
VNSAGDVVGLAETTPGHPASRPFLYQNGVLTDMTTLLPGGSDWHLLLARTITDNGLVVGVGRHGSSLNYHAFLLDLNASDPSIPAPGAALQVMSQRVQSVSGETLSTSASHARPAVVTSTDAAPAPTTRTATSTDSSLVVNVQASAAAPSLGGELTADGMFNL